MKNRILILSWCLVFLAFTMPLYSDWEFGDPETSVTITFEEADGYVAGLSIAGRDNFVSFLNGDEAVVTNTTSHTGAQCLAVSTSDTAGWRGVTYDTALFDEYEGYDIFFWVKGKWICRMFNDTGTSWGIDLVGDGSLGEAYAGWDGDEYEVADWTDFLPDEWVRVHVSPRKPFLKWDFNIWDSGGSDILGTVLIPYRYPDPAAIKYLVVSPYQPGDSCYIDDMNLHSFLPTQEVPDWRFY